MNYSVTEVKNISNFTGLNFAEVKILPYWEYLLYRKEAWLSELRQSEDGREFLKTLWRLKQTVADTTAIELFEDGR